MARDYAPKTLNGLASQVAKDVFKKVGNTIAKDMAHEYIHVIKEFYNDYTPHAYNRTYRSYYFAGTDYVGKGGVKSYTKFVKMDKDGKGFTVRMVISPGNLTTPYTSIVNGKGTSRLTGTVFANTWILGQHGGKLPYNAIPEDLRISNPIDNRWRFLKKTGLTWIPPVMERSPMELMNEWFDTYATNKNLNSLTREVVTNSINRYILRMKKRYGGIK